MKIVTRIEVRKASRLVRVHLRIDRRVRWFARVRRRWVPMTAAFREAAGLERCHTYRAQGAFEQLGFRVRRFKRATAIRLQIDLMLYP